MYKIVLSLLFALVADIAYGYGLGFYDSSYPIDDRTAYNLFGEKRPEFHKRFLMTFDMAVMPPVEGGYIFRIQTSEKNDSLVYNLFFNLDGDNNYLFRFNQEGKTVLISLPVKKEILTRNHWFKVGIDINLKTNNITLQVGDRRMSCHVESLPDKICPIVTFGRNDYLIDVPSMAINNVRIEDELPLFVPLNEDVGNKVTDSSGLYVGSVENPIWLVNSAYHWQCEMRTASEKRAGVIYDEERHRFYYFNCDSLKVFDPGSGKTDSVAFRSPCPVPLFLATSFMIPGENRLYVYEVYPKDYAPGPMMASVALDSMEWRVECERPLSMQLHHHDGIYNEVNGDFLFFGGFGNQYFSNKFYSFKPGNGEYVQVDSIGGDRISPRYFTAMGHLEGSPYAYIFGGMGNDSGEQIVGRRYFYDLHRLDLKAGTVERMWDLSDIQENTVPSRGMAVVDDKYFFVLRYPESKSSSFLKLYKFSIADGTYEALGDSIPIRSDKITTNAHLWFDKQHGKFYVSVQETDDDVASTLTVYSLNYPPITEATFTSLGHSGSGIARWLFGLFVFLLCSGIVWLALRLRRRSKRASRSVPDIKSSLQENSAGPTVHRRPDSIYLFGDFEAVNSSGRDVSYMFTTRLRTILCLILQYNDGDGISSSRLGSLVWPDKPKDKVKNSRGVAVNSLRKILAEFKDVSLVHENSCFHISAGPDFYCDYLRCFTFISDDEELSKNRIEFLDILSRGKFLKGFEDPVFDDFKRQVEVLLENAILRQIKSTFETGYYRECIRFVQAEFEIDPLNEAALRCGLRSLMFLNQSKSARVLYHRYAEEYLRSSGENMPLSFESLLM